VRSYNRNKERVCAKKGKDVFIVKREERRGARVYQRTIEKRVH